MSRHFDLPAYKRASRTQPCPFCKAGIGHPCRDRSGRVTTVHSARREVVWRAQSIGYEEGLTDALDILDWQARKPGASIDQVREAIADQLGTVRNANLREEEVARGLE